MKVFSSSSYKAFLYKNKCYISDIKNGTNVRTIECGSEILMGLFSSDSAFVVLTTFLKTLEVYSIETGEMKYSAKLEKKCSAMVTRIHNGTEYLIMGDKVGDILAFDLPALSKKTFLVGHCATVITGLVNIGDYIASSDRDEKVFVCHFPQTFNIQSICVGHKQYVSCIEAVNQQLVTGSADGSLRLFDITTGECKKQWFLDELLNIDSEEETVLIPSQLFALSESQVACIVENSSKLLVLSVDDDSCKCIEMTSEPVVISREAGAVHIFTKDVKTFELNSTLTLKELDCPCMKWLKEQGYVYEKTTDEQEGGELFKQTVKNKLTVSLGFEKQFEHNNKKMKKCFDVYCHN